jgi:hypothetical protein
MPSRVRQEERLMASVDVVGDKEAAAMQEQAVIEAPRPLQVAHLYAPKE